MEIGLCSYVIKVTHSGNGSKIEQNRNIRLDALPETKGPQCLESLTTNWPG